MVDAGIRYDHNSHIGEAWVPQGGMTILLPHNMQVKAVVAKGFRYPTIREMYMFPPQNPDLRPEQIINYEVSLHQQLHTLNYGINLYMIDGKNMIQTQFVDGRPKNVNTGKIDNRGIEAELSWQAHKRWRLMANYSYLHMKNPIVASPEHKLLFAVRYSHNRWSVSSTLQHINGLITQREPVKKESYTLWNLSAEYQATKRIQLYLHGENLLAERYEINAGYPMPRATFNTGIKLSL
jgi:iron complex outermembrane receptor protein